jgi:hypothetical protein
VEPQKEVRGANAHFGASSLPLDTPYRAVSFAGQLRSGRMTMASQRQIDANRKNSAKSTGPKTPEGLEKSSLNAIVHGLRSKKIGRARDDSYSFENRRMKRMASADASDDCEEFLVYLSVCQSFDIEHAQRAQIERVTDLIENFDENELEEVTKLGKRLFFDPAGPTPLYGIEPHYRPKGKKTSWNGEAVDTNDPAVLVRALEKSLLGCTWLRFRWLELKARAETSYWQGLDRLKAVRLLGFQPIDALEDERVAKIFVASYAIRTLGEHEYVELGGEMTPDRLAIYANAAMMRWPDLLPIEHETEGREALIKLVDQEIDHLDELLKAHALNADAVAEKTLDRLRLDESPTGKYIRGYKLKATSAFYRGLEAARKFKKGRDPGKETREERRVPEGPWRGAVGLIQEKPRGAEPEEVDLSWAYEPNAQGDHGNEAIGGADGASPRELARIDVILDTVLSDGVTDSDEQGRRAEGGGWRAEDKGWQAADSVRLPERHASDHGSRADIQRNDTNEANFDENMITVEITKPVEVTANFGPDLRLDKVADQPGEEGELEGTEVQEVGTLIDEIGGSEFEILNPKSEIRKSETEVRSSKSEIRKSETESTNPEPTIENSRSPSAGSGDRVAGGRMRKASAKREMRSARREKAKKERERRRSKGVENKAGGVPVGELIGDVPGSPPLVSESLWPRLPRSP